MNRTHLMSNTQTCRCSNAAAAGTSAINGTVLDMTGYDAVRGIALLGTLTSTQVTKLKAQQGDASDGSDMADISGAVTPAAADADSNKILILDVNRESITKQYVRFVVVRGTANAVLDGLIADRYQCRTLPQTQSDSTVSQATKVA